MARKITDKKIYICGKVTGDPDYKAKFARAEAELRAAGFTTVVNPARVVPAGTPWAKAMRMTLAAMLGCDSVALLPDWAESAGAGVELAVAKPLGFEIDTAPGWAAFAAWAKNQPV